MTDEHDRVIELFTQAAELPFEERAVFLDLACAGDEDLRRRIEALLRSHDRAGDLDFMVEPPTWEIGGGRLRAATGEAPGERIGNCRLIRQIGEGGCGVVFIAEQEEPIRRRVALKVIKPGMDTKSVIARFEAERQALALMDHPNIAHVFEAGATHSGRPYFVMELVEGEKISDYCKRHALPLDARLQVFVQVCAAIEHAHQKGIIHRDIKPSNILVITGREGRPVPKVIDFGIAKATTGQQLTDKTLFTSWGTLMGTPAYMSPEQATLASGELDTRTDIYSLGVVLYELLTGAPPFDTQELLKAGFDEVRRVIRDEEPVRPSTRLSTMLGADLANISKHHGAAVPKLIREMRGDLDWIVMKALEKDRTRRYATTDALAMDIERYLAGEAVAARPPSATYKFRKLYQRNRLYFGAAGIVAAIFIAGFIAVALALKREKLARIETDKSRQQAETDKLASEQTSRFMEDMLEGVGPSAARGRDTEMLREILDKTVARIDVKLAGQPAIQAKLQFMLGNVYFDLGQLRQSEEMFRRSLATRTRLFGEESAATAESMVELGNALGFQSREAEAETYVRRGLEVRRKLFGEESAGVAQCYFALGSLHWGRKQVPEAETLLRQALAMQLRLLDAKDPLLGHSFLGLGCVMFEKGQYQEAEGMFQKALGNWEGVLAEDDPAVIRCVANLSTVLSVTGKNAEAEVLMRRALATRRKVFGDGHEKVIDSLDNLTRMLNRLNRPAEAESAGREALQMARRLWGSTREETLHVLRDLINALLMQRKFGEAEELFAELLPPGKELEAEYAGLLYERCDTHARCSRWREAAADAAILLKEFPGDHENYHLLALLLVQLGEGAEYQRLCATMLGKFGGTRDLSIAGRTAQDCLLLPSPEVDLKAVAACVELAANAGPDTDASPQLRLCKGLAEFRAGRYGEAVTWAGHATSGSPEPIQACACAVLAMAQSRLGRADEARTALAECDKIIGEQLPNAGQDLGRDWRDWVIAHAMQEEAKRTVAGE